MPSKKLCVDQEIGGCGKDMDVNMKGGRYVGLDRKNHHLILGLEYTYIEMK